MMKYANSMKVCLMMLMKVFVSAIVGMFLLWIAYLLPVEPMAKNMLASYDTIRAQDTWDDDYLAALEWAEILDTGTNIIMFHEVIYPNTGNAFQDALLAPGGDVWSNMVGDWTSGLMQYAEDRVYTPESTVTYARYWHGYLILLKPLFLLMDLDGIYLMNTIVMLALSGAVLFLMYKRLGMYSLAYVVMMLCMHPENIAVSFQLSSIFYAMHITLLFMLIKKNWSEEQILHFFVLDGILVAYFDFLTYPAVAVAVPLLTYLLINQKPTFIDNFMIMLKNGLSFFFGYAGMWGMKWVFATLFTDENVIADAINSVLHRTGMVESNADVMSSGVSESLYRNLVTFFDDGNSIVFTIAIILSVVLVVMNHKKLQVNKQISIFCFFMCLVPFAWLVVLSNHCSLHPHLEWRTLCIFVYAVAIFVISLFQPKEQLKK